VTTKSVARETPATPTPEAGRYLKTTDGIEFAAPPATLTSLVSKEGSQLQLGPLELLHCPQFL
jgi:hypothetical protein